MVHNFLLKKRPIKTHGITILLMLVLCLFLPAATKSSKIEKWNIFELSFKGPSDGNPFTEVSLSGSFTNGNRTLKPQGFYDGKGIYRIRFMPVAVGTWKYVTKSNRKELNGKKGEFTCVNPSKENHGPVVAGNNCRFFYADGTPYFSVGTTCYAWAHQGKKLEEQTLATLKKSPFNKIRMCVFPKNYVYNKNEPKYYPFVGKPLKDWDFTRFNPEFFHHFETLVGRLRYLGIQSDIILFHPYDRWGFSHMKPKDDDRYLRYVVARLAAYRNVWWSLANEYDFMKSKKMSDWDRFFQIVRDNDPYGHLRGIHNGRTWYDHTKPWVTHASLQTTDFRDAQLFREKYKKPIVYDECRYEGNIPQGWGHLSGLQMVRNFWYGTLSGCYVGHGETFLDPKDILWWSKGGVLHGQSPTRIAFLKKLIMQLPFWEMVPRPKLFPGNYTFTKPGNVYLIYFTKTGRISLNLPGSSPYKLDEIDPWDMTISAIGSASPGKFSYSPPRIDLVLRISKYLPGEKIRPEVKFFASPETGTAPLKVKFTTTAGKLKCRWEFGDGSGATEKNSVHTYKKPGIFIVKLTVTDEAGSSAHSSCRILVDRAQVAGTPIVKLGFKGPDNTPATIHGGRIKIEKDGAYNLGGGPPWKWITVGTKPIEALENLYSFTIMGWVKPVDMRIGKGGNRIAFNLNYNRGGFDLVCLADGRLRLAVNEWPDQCIDDSSPGRLKPGKWVFFAVTYNSTAKDSHVRWYFGDENTPAALDRTTDYSRGPTGRRSGPLTIGNYNTTIQRHGKDRQFRGSIRAVEIYGSKTGGSGALSLEKIRKCQK